MNPPSHPDDIPPEIRDGILAGTIGAISFIIRMLVSTEKHSYGYVIRRTVIAGLTSFFVGMATQSYFSNQGLGYAAAGMAGYASPELIEALLLWIKRQGKAKRDG